MGKSQNSRFRKGGMVRKGGIYTCKSCKKRTRETGDEESDLGLCRRCLRDSYWDNFHGDHGHNQMGFTERETCPHCLAAGYSFTYLEG